MHQKVDQPDDLLFPVRAVPVYADLRGGANEGLQRDTYKRADEELHRIPGQRAIVNCEAEQVISVVSENYQVVTNREALHYAQLCCQAAFPESPQQEWRIVEAHAPTTMGSCRIDLVHPASALDFGGPKLHGKADTFGPFVRVTNSYNRSRALGFEIGFFRKVCSNGMILPKANVRFSFNHNTRKISEHVAFQVQADSFKGLREKFRKFLEPLWECDVPLNLFAPATRAVLRISKPDPLGKRQREPWEKLAAYLESVSKKYAWDIGLNGYALMNVITDVATRPPKGPFIRREQHGLQRSAGIWLADFSEECRKPGFKVKAYVDRLEQELTSRTRTRQAGSAFEA